MIQEYKHELLSGKPCMVHSEFVPVMDLFCQYLKISGCKASINSSFRMNSNHIQGAIVAPVSMSNHFIGHAIDCNIIDKTGNFWTSEMLEQFAPESPKYNPSLTNEILMLINLVRRSTTLRWGGDFKIFDTIHFDDSTNLKNSKRWHKLYDELHKSEI